MSDRELLVEVTHDYGAGILVIHAVDAETKERLGYIKVSRDFIQRMLGEALLGGRT